MPYIKSTKSYSAYREALERALQSPKGVRISYPSREVAFSERAKFNYVRSMDRADSTAIYQPGDPKHGASPYDDLVLSIPARGTTEEAVLYILHRALPNIDIEELQ